MEMHFLPDVYVPCEVCHGKRYNRETLEVQYKGKNISQVLDMTVEEAREFFDAVPTVSRKLQTLMDALKKLDTYSKEKDKEIFNNVNYKDILVELYEKFIQKEKFQPGDLITWKKGLQNRKYPTQNNVAVVIQQLEEPIIDNESSSGSPTFREPLDLIAGIIAEDGSFITYYYDSRRFIKFK